MKIIILKFNILVKEKYHKITAVICKKKINTNNITITGFSHILNIDY